MEDRAPYHTLAPSGPRNLAPYIAAWLRELGFAATEATHGPLATVGAIWQSPEGHRFYFDYQWSAQRAVVSLDFYYCGERHPLNLVRGQHVGRLREVRHLLLHDVHFREARNSVQRAPTPAASF